MRSMLQQLAAHPRPVGSVHHAAARELLERLLREAGLQPYQGDRYALPYHQESGKTFANLVGVLPGSDPTLPPILLGAHYDTVLSTPGADDNAAACLVILQSIVNLRPGTLKRNILITFFDAEEPTYYLGPLMGSTNLYNQHLEHDRQCGERVHCAFIFDLVGHNVPVPGIEDVIFVTGAESHRAFAEPLKNLSQDTGVRLVPALNKYVGDMSDHHVFRINHEPYLFFSAGRWKDYHEPTDTVDGVNPEKMVALAAYIERLLVACDGVEFPRNASAHDTTPMDLNAMNTVLGGVLRSFGMYPLGNRADIDRAVERLMFNLAL